MAASSESPAELGYRWPAEWEPHRATWLSWPHNRETWPGGYPPIPARFAQLVHLLAEYEPVKVLAGGAQVIQQAQRHLGHSSQVEIIDIPTNDAWCRDHGPSFLVGPPGSPPALIDWEYNAWGGKYPPFAEDNAVPRRIAERFGYRRFHSSIVLEGGAVDTNGAGTLLASSSCLLATNRNPGLAQADLEQELRQHFNVTDIRWLARGELAGDDTDGHTDQLARFVASNVLVAAVEPDSSDQNHAPLRENFEALRQELSPQGGNLEVLPLEMPRPRYAAGQRLPASYCNFYIANGLVLVPQFSDPNDDRAIGVLRDLFPTRQVVGFDCTEIVLGLGAIHCLTQTEFETTA